LENSTNQAKSPQTKTYTKRKRINFKLAFYGLSIIIILALSTATVDLYNANQAQRQQLTFALAESSNDASVAIFQFVGEYNQQSLRLNQTLSSSLQFDVNTKSIAAQDFLIIMGEVANHHYNSLVQYLGRIQSLTSFVNQTTYDRIEQIVGFAMAQVDTMDQEDNFTLLATNVPVHVNQLNDILGINSNSRGLPGIARSFQMMSNYYYYNGQGGETWTPP
jgi:hypothetical protein